MSQTNGRNIKKLIELVKNDLQKNIKKFTESELVKILKKLSDVYYNTNESIVDDTTYDILKDQLESLNPHNPFLEEVGAPIKGTKEKIELPFEMGSLTKIKPGSDELEKFTTKYPGPYVVSDKLDGASIQIYKNSNGKTSQKVMLYSRGNGKVGQDISHLVKFLVNDDVIKKMPNNTSVRGELIISIKDFEKISSYMKNARNAVSGLVNSKTVDAKVANITQMIAYSVLYPKYKQSEQMELLKSWGFDVVDYQILNNLDEDNLQELLLERKKKSKFEMDGLVCVDDSNIYTETGGYPDHAFAFKILLSGQIAVATVEHIEWNISMDAYVKPRIKIQPINLVGTTITYATGFNANFIFKHKLGKGAKVKLVRSGDVIPYILEVIEPAKTGKAEMPDFKYEWNDTHVDIIADLNDKSVKKLMNLKLLMHFFTTMGIKYLGKGILAKFIDAGLDDVFKILTAKKKVFDDMEGVGEVLIKKIYNEILRAFSEVNLETFMGASHKFGRGLGVRKLEEIIDMYPNIMTNDWTKTKMIEKIIAVPGFAEKTATLFANNFAEFKKFYNKIATVIDISRFENINENNSETDSEIDSNASESDTAQPKKNKNNLSLKNITVVFTGFRDNNLKNKIKINGGKVTTSVSKNTNILLHDYDPETLIVKIEAAKKSKKSKFETAKTLGVRILSLSEFKKEFNL